MKKYNFIIKNFYSIFNQMPEGNQNKNFDSYLDDKISHSLQAFTSDDFTLEMMKRIELDKEFAKEDVKTYRIVKYIIGGFAFLLTALIIMFSFLLNTGGESKNVSIFNGAVEKFSNIIESISIALTENLGFAFTSQTGIIILLLMACVFLFSFADKAIFKKQYK